jgi:hypothetical protein
MVKHSTGNGWCTQKLRTVLIPFYADYFQYYNFFLFGTDAVIRNIYVLC